MGIPKEGRERKRKTMKKTSILRKQKVSMSAKGIAEQENYEPDMLEWNKYEKLNTKVLF